jgi:hypothetical protein
MVYGLAVLQVSKIPSHVGRESGNKKMIYHYHYVDLLSPSKRKWGHLSQVRCVHGPESGRLRAHPCHCVGALAEPALGQGGQLPGLRAYKKAQ